ncbi:MAG TPA: bifunctional transaldolase/phosoglucose isomerase [Solirubrobacteraceae bacterium]|nr:bifunctional transaldolase/phosoglucose isomerase [Solirubrobacteraceae bacterium]
MSVTPANERLAALTAAGTSVWLDQIRRGMIESGELERMVVEESLRGVTSNPAIFEKAILGSPDYDDDLAAAAREGLSAREVYRRLAIKDVQLAADVLRPVYDESGGTDGFVSLEVAPRLAHDTEGTLEQARMYWGLVERPNVMIKIPATDAGLPAIEQALYEGLHVNVTLLFAVSAYERVMEAFIRAMERRHEEGLPLDRHSVASFFVSRVDTEVDKRLDKLGRTDLQGRAGLANARAAYRAFRRIFGGERFAALREAGCPVQRPLWASTGVKNPLYPETMYVYGLVAPDTVNTMPLPTLQAAAHQGEVTGATADEDPAADLEALAAAGVDLDDVTDQLLREGIEAFMVPMNKLLSGIESKREMIVTDRPATFDADLPPELEQPVADRVRQAREEDVVHRLWRRDGTLWAPAGTPELEDRLGWLTIAEKSLEDLPEIKDFARELREEGFTDVVLLGMGGSSLAPEVFRRSSPPSEGALRLHVLDSTEPVQVKAVADAVDPAATLFIVSTKSGGTIEPNALLAYFRGLQPDPRHFVAITDPGTSMAELAEREGFRRTFLSDPEIGGRYSALSPFGIVPATLAGVDTEAVLEGARVAMENCESPAGNIGLWLGAALGEMALRGRDKLTFVVDPPISSFGLWAEQLVAESTGKQGRGILPIADEPLADASAYGDDRVFVHLRDADGPDGGHEEAMRALARAGHPTISLTSRGVGDLGRIFFTAEFATAVAGWALGINPFDQPNVQEAKDNTNRVLDEGPPADLPEGSPDELLAALSAPAYVAIMGYLPYDDAIDEAVNRLRAAVLERDGVATTWGYGPRFLHSTGQFHKGGPPTGRFLQLVSDAQDDLPVPGQSYSFRTLIDAQADGDLQTLREHGLPAVRVRLGAGDLAGAIARVQEQLDGKGA